MSSLRRILPCAPLRGRSTPLKLIDFLYTIECFAVTALVCVELAISPPTCRAQSASDAVTNFTSAQKAMAANRPEVAEHYLLLSEASARAALGDISLFNGKPAEAIGLYDQAAPILGKSRPLLLSKAMALSQIGKSADAAIDLRSSLRTHPGDLAARRLLGEVLATMGDMRGALSEFKGVLQHLPKDPETLYMAGAASLKLGDIADARSEFAMLGSTVPGAATEVLVGRTYRDLHFDHESAIHLRKALRLDPHIQRAHYYLATLDIMREGEVNLQEAATEFEQELILFPNDYLSNLYLGIVLEQEHLPSGAEPYLQRATELKSSSPDGYIFLATCYFEQQKYELAKHAAMKAISLTPDPAAEDYRIANTHYILAQALRKLGKILEADEEVKISQQLKQQANRASQIDLKQYLTQTKQQSEDTNSVHWVTQKPSPTLTDTGQEQEHHLRQLLLDDQFNLGNLYLHQGRVQEAASELALAFQQSPDYPGLLKLYGTSLFLLDKYDAAIPVLHRAIDVSPNDTESRSFLGQAYCKKESYSDAVKTLRNGYWHDIPTQYALAISLARDGDDAGASRAFATLLEEHPHSAEIENLLGQAASGQKQYTLAVTHFEKALELNPNVPEAHLGIGLIDMRNGELAGAGKEFRLEMTTHPGDLRTQFYLAYVLGLQQDHVEAVRMLRKIIDQRPDFPEAHAALASELLAENQPQEALSEFLQADKLNPGQAKLQYQIGVAFRKLGQTHEAEKYFVHFRELQKLETEKHPAGGMGGADIR